MNNLTNEFINDSNLSVLIIFLPDLNLLGKMKKVKKSKSSKVK